MTESMRSDRTARWLPKAAYTVGAATPLAAQTEGHYSLFEARRLTGGGVPLHRHHHDEEAVFVLDGRYRFQLGDEHLELGPVISCT
jgi:quercetin dioxygenase-like cupin family protein